MRNRRALLPGLKHTAPQTSTVFFHQTFFATPPVYSTEGRDPILNNKKTHTLPSERIHHDAGDYTETAEKVRKDVERITEKMCDVWPEKKQALSVDRFYGKKVWEASQPNPWGDELVKAVENQIAERLNVKCKIENVRPYELVISFKENTNITRLAVENLCAFFMTHLGIKASVALRHKLDIFDPLPRLHKALEKSIKRKNEKELSSDSIRSGLTR